MERSDIPIGPTQEDRHRDSSAKNPIGKKDEEERAKAKEEEGGYLGFSINQ